MKHRRLLAGLAMTLVPLTAGAEVSGADLFERHCAVCHGAGATGDGPLAPALVLQPKDLTLLAEQNAGIFPVIRVVMRIDGRDPLVSHGSPMPVYGEYFAGNDMPIKAETGQPILAVEEVVALTEFLRDLQAE